MGAAATVVNGTMMGKSASRADFGAPDDGGQREGGFEHGEVVADAGADRVLHRYARKNTPPALRTGGASLSMYQRWW
jgi:hypothetical protein